MNEFCFRDTGVMGYGVFGREEGILVFVFVRD